MRSTWALSLGLAVSAACNGLTGADDLRAGAAADPTNAIPGGDARAPASPAPSDGGSEASGDGGASVPDSGLDSGLPPKPDAGATALDEGFDQSSDCLGWATIGPATRQAHADGHYGAGSCLLCATGPGDVFLTKTINTPMSATYAVYAWAKRPAGTSPSGFRTEFESSLGGGGATTSLSTTTWREGRGAKVSLPDNTDVTVRVGIKAAVSGDCLIVDDVMLAIE